MKPARKTIYRGAIVDLGVETVRLPNRRTVELEIVRHPGGAVVIAEDARGNIALLRQFRHAAGGWIWELPAGLIEVGETPLQTAQRELREETGCVAVDWRALGVLLMTPGFCDERLHVFCARELTIGAPAREEDELMELHWTPPARAVQMAVGGEMDDAKSVAALLRRVNADGEGGDLTET